MQVDTDILKKYDRPGPRYTSYPTAPHFHEEFGPADFRREIEASNSKPDSPDLSLYFHLPFCRQLCFFCGCNMILTRKTERVARYLQALKKEIDLFRNLIDPKRKVVQFHWGGGTPTYLSPEQCRDLFEYTAERFSFAENAEISIEIHPGWLQPEHLRTLREVGFNRVSFGVQDFNPLVQETINRVQPEQVTRDVVKESRDLGFDSINVDLIYGLPHQNVDSYRETLEKVLDIRPDRLAVFNYAHVPWLSKRQNAMPAEAMPQADEKLRMLKLIIERLTEAGYVYIGMDHFAEPDDPLCEALKNHTLYRNFQGYSTFSNAEIHALGITSISGLHRCYAQNLKTEEEYFRRVEQEMELATFKGVRLSDDDILRRHVITELMCNNRLVKADVEKKFSIDFDDYFADSLAQLGEFEADGLVKNESDQLRISHDGRLVVRNIAMAFDAYLETDRKREQPIYSRTV